MEENKERKAPLEATAEREIPARPAADLEKLFRDHNALVFRAAYRITGSATDAEDVLQTVFLRLIAKGVESLDPAYVDRYLHRAAVNGALDLLRSRQSGRSVPLEDVEAVLVDDPVRAPDRVHASGEIRQWLRRTIARLSPRGAEIFALRYLEGKDNAEIAEIVGTTPSTIAVTLHRTRERIQKEFLAFLGGNR